MPVLETHNGYLLWHYIPNRPAAIIFCILFVILTFAHIFFMIRSRLWFCIPFVLGGICAYLILLSISIPLNKVHLTNDRSIFS